MPAPLSFRNEIEGNTWFCSTYENRQQIFNQEARWVHNLGVLPENHKLPEGHKWRCEEYMNSLSDDAEED